MSPENVERGRRPVSRENSRGPGRRSVAIFFVPICLKTPAERLWLSQTC
jgi:hypothetical protein